MAIPNVHTQRHRQSRRLLVQMIVAYRLPLAIFVAAVALTIGYNLFFLQLLGTIARVRSKTPESKYIALHEFHSRHFWFTYPSTHTLALAALSVGDLLFALMFWSFLRAIFTCAGYVPPEPWRWAPQADAAVQRSLQERWSRQQEWLRAQEEAALRRVAEMRRLEQQQQAWWSAQLSALQWQQGPQQEQADTAMDARPPLSSGVVAAAAIALNPASPQLVRDVTKDGTSHTVGADASADATQPALLKAIHAGSGDTVVGTTSTTPLTSSSTLISAGQHRETKPPDTPVGPPENFAAAASTSLSSSRGTSSSAMTHDSASVISVPPAAGAEDVASLHCAHHTGSAALSHPPPLSRSADRSLNGVRVYEYEADGSLRFCEPCNQYKPDKSHHCRACQRCVFDMDHHCHFLNNCVGRNNYKFFYLCIFYSTLCGTVNSALFASAFVGSAVCVRWTRGWWLVPAGMSAIGVCVAYLWVQHTFLMVRGVSTLDRMAQLASERFLARLSGGQSVGSARGSGGNGCCCTGDSDCALTARAIAGALRGVVMRWLPRAVSRGRTSAHGMRYAHAGAAAESVVSASGMLSQAERRARRIELFFGRPRYVLEYVLPIAPRSTHSMTDEKSDGRICVEAV